MVNKKTNDRVPPRDSNGNLITEKVDPNTLHLVLDFVEHHYYAIKHISQFMFQGEKKQQFKYCYWCYSSFVPHNYSNHACYGSNIKHFQCDICKDLFFNQEVYQNHLAEESSGWDCECCKKQVFRGNDCYEKHIETNCIPPDQLESTRCQDCHRKYIVRSGHECKPYYQCSHCEEKFINDTLLFLHTCYFNNEKQQRKSKDQFIQKNQFKEGSKRKNVYYEPHWFYDFETCREVVSTNDIGKYRHEVMAWAMKLICLPSTSSEKWKEYYQKMLEQIIKELKKVNLPQDIQWERIPSDHSGLDSVYITGKSLKSFMELIWLHLQSNSMKPIFWAHNGSKFDGKFVLDYILNVGKYELAGDAYFHENRLAPQLISGPNDVQEFEWRRRPMKRKLKAVCQVAMIGSKALSIKADNVTFRCSWAHLAAPLAKLPKMFGFPDTLRKGEFPYGRLSQTAWGSQHLDGLPPLAEYNPDTKKPEDRKKLIDWWFEEQVRRNASNNVNDQVISFLPDFTKRHLHNPSQPTIPWDFDTELWSYLKADIQVGARAMYMYHVTALKMQEPLVEDGGLSPLEYTTSPAWAKDMWQLYFMPEQEVAVLKPFHADFVRAGLRGGRTDKRASIVTLTDEAFARGDRIQYYDFKSLYPSVQKCSVHDTYYPSGKADDAVLKNHPNMCNQVLLEYMENLTGFLEIDAKHLKYVTHPTLCRIKDVSGTPKLMFTNEDTVKEIYCWPEIEEAILSGEIEVTKVHAAVVFGRTTKTFNKYVDFFFKVKQDAEDTENEGLRSLAKLMLNSLWGKLGQKSYATNEWVHTVERERYLQKQFENKVYEFVHCIPKGNAQNHYSYRITPDHNNLKTTAAHIAAHVSTWGRVMLHRKVLRLHGQRALYCDTDSAIIYLRKDDEMPFVGDDLGDLTNEVPKILKDGGKTFTGEAYIREAVFVAPKTYALHIQTTCGVNYYKVVCKGFEPSYQNAKSFHFENFKKLVQDKAREEGSSQGTGLRYITGAPTLRFESSLSRQNITPMETYTVKKLSGDYDKGVVHPQDDRLIIPYGPFQPEASFLQEMHPTKHYE